MFRTIVPFTPLVAAAALLFGDTAIVQPPAKRVLLLGQKPDNHPPGSHEYMAGQRLLAKLLAPAKALDCRVVQADDPWTDGPQLLKDADGVVLFVSEGARWISSDASRLDAFRQLSRRGGGLVVLHWGMGTREAKNIDAFAMLFGGCHGGPDRKFREIADAEIRVADAEHPVTRGVSDFRARDEFYYRLKWVQPATGLRPVLRVPIDGALETVAWSWDRPDGGRSFGFSGLHYHENWHRESYRRLVAQSALWTMRQPIPDRGFDVPVNESDRLPR